MTEDRVSTAMRLEVRDVSCRRGERLLFRGVSLGIEQGTLLQVVGPNGCGKTTFLRLLCGLRRPDEGSVLWRNQPLNGLNSGFRSELAYVGHRAGIKDDLTPVENLETANALAGGAPERVLSAVKSLGISSVAMQPCHSLSVGQRRRVALARLLVSPAWLWILDEPLTGLDVAGQSLTARLMIEHAEKGGLIVFTSHQPLELRHDGLQSLQLA